MPTILADESKKVLEGYTEEKTKKEILEYVEDVLGRRKKEMEELLIQVKSKDKEA